MFLQALPRIFTWQEPAAELDELHRSYLGLLAGRLGELLSRLEATPARPLADAIQHQLQRLENAMLAATLAAPEASYRLLWSMQHEHGDAAAFLLQALRTAAAAARGESGGAGAWLAAGNAYLAADGALVQPWGSPGGLPLDCGSPHALAVDVSGERVRALTPAQLLQPDQLRSTLPLLARAVRHTRRCAPHAWRMAHNFTKALILLPDPAAPRQFSSGSSGQFVGRSVLANPHLAKVTEVQLAEALVHEAIHAVLYMDEQHDAWTLDPALYAGPMRITSPWTGNRLPLRPFLQAAFVWYGLLAFWSQAGAAGLFPQQGVRERLNEAAAGFLRVDLLDEVAPVVDSLSPEVVAAVGELQERVRAVLDTAA